MLKDLGTPTRGLVRPAGLPPERRRRRTVLVLVVLAACTLMVLDARPSPGSPVEPLRRAAAAVFGPLESGATSARQPVDSLRDRFAETDTLTAENARLRADNQRLTAELRTTEYARQRAAELDRLLRVAPAYTVTPARVVGIGGAQGFQHTVTIDAGTADGVRAEMTVLTGDGLAGRVVRATEATATVLLIGDRNSTVGGRLNATMALGFVTGRGETGTLDYALVDLRARPKVGDRIVTWGSKGNAPYVPGVPIGTVTSVTPNQGALGSTATVRPFVDPRRIDTVGVVTGPPARAPRAPLSPQSSRPAGAEPRR